MPAQPSIHSMPNSGPHSQPPDTSLLRCLLRKLRDSFLFLVICGAEYRDSRVSSEEREANNSLKPQQPPPKEMAPSLEDLQKLYIERGFGMFLHFNLGTFTNEEWAKPGRKDVATIFNPSHLDTDQWADAAKAAGMKYAVLTTKHHDGFALWETSVPELQGYNVQLTDWYKAEKAAGRSGDIVRRYVDSFRSRGIAPGFYFSIWDRTAGLDNRKTSDKEWATQFVKNQLTELLTRYGEIPCIWTDGWKWYDSKIPNSPVGYDLVDYQEVYDHVKRLSPNTLLVENNHQKNLEHTDIVGFGGFFVRAVLGFFVFFFGSLFFLFVPSRTKCDRPPSRQEQASLGSLRYHPKRQPLVLPSRTEQ